MRALITGGMGHVGRLLTAALTAREHQALILDKGVPDHAGVSMDITDSISLAALLRQERFDAVFHLAGLGAAAPRAEMERVNIEGTRVILEAAEGTGARVLVMSSSAVYGACTDDPITEESPLVPVMPYGVSKAACEDLARSAAARGWVVIARPFNIIGPGQRAPMLQTAVLTQLVAIERGLVEPLLKLGWLGNSRDFIDVRDVADGLIAIVEKGRSGQAYNLCSGEATKVRVLVEKLVRLSSRDIAIQDVKDKPSGADVPYQRGSASKLQQASGWSARISLDQSLRDSFEWQHQHG